MKKLLLASFLTGGLSISAYAVPGADSVPVDNKGGVTNPQYAGSRSCFIGNSTGTNSLLCDTGAGIILAVYASSVAATDQIVFRDSATANNSSTRLLAMDKAGLAEEGKFYPQYKNGLSVTLGVAPAAAGPAVPSWTVIYRPLD